MNTYDVIVLGAGGVGSAAAFHLARRGSRVLALDRFPGGHDRGSSHGQTRIIRKAYFEHPDYVPLLQRAYILWHELEQEVGQSLYFPNGLIEIGPADGLIVPGVLHAARLHHLPVEQLDAAEFAKQFPGFVLPENYQALFERDAGYLLVEACVLAHQQAARQHGAELRLDAEVIGWEATPEQITVRTAKETFHAAKLVVSAGAWAKSLLDDLGVRFRIRRKHLHWYASPSPHYASSQCCPTFFYELPEGQFYGFPSLDEQGVKIAEHTGGVEIDDPLFDPRQDDPTDRQRVDWFRQMYLPEVTNRLTRHAVCFYTSSPDEHFLLGLHPQHDRVALAAGLSGHGFKFASVLGEVLADLAFQGDTELPISFLSPTRPALRQPS